MPQSPPRHNAHKAQENRKAQQVEYNKKQRTGQEFYNTTAWRKLRRAYAKANPVCETCRKNGRATAVAVVDHIEEIKNGGDGLAWDNLQSLCHLHHNQKTAQGRAG